MFRSFHPWMVSLNEWYIFLMIYLYQEEFHNLSMRFFQWVNDVVEIHLYNKLTEYFVKQTNNVYMISM
jgi:hypothetical protein